MLKRKIITGLLGICILTSITIPCLAAAKVVKFRVRTGTKTAQQTCENACFPWEVSSVQQDIHEQEGYVNITCYCRKGNDKIMFKNQSMDVLNKDVVADPKDGEYWHRYYGDYWVQGN